MLNLSLPTSVCRVISNDIYLTVYTLDGAVRRMKNWCPDIKAKLTLAMQDNTIVRFKSFGNWDVNNWFSEVVEVVPAIVPVTEDVMLADYTVMDKKDYALFIEAVKYGLKRLRLDDVGVDIKLKPHYEVKTDSHTYGYAGPVSFENKDYRIMVSYNKDIRKCLDTLFHELRHIAQWNSGVMKTGFGLTKWKDEQYVNNQTDYFTSPWEVDARKAAAIMVNSFFEDK